MGTNYNGDGTSRGDIPKIFNEVVYDLLGSNSTTLSKNEATPYSKPINISRPPIRIRETASGGIYLTGVTELEVKTKEMMATYLARGSMSRATGSTKMNSQSRCVDTIAVLMPFSRSPWNKRRYQVVVHRQQMILVMIYYVQSFIWWT